MPGLFGLLLLMEAGVPVPVPGDLVMLLVGERVSVGALPLWLAVVALELVAAAGSGLPAGRAVPPLVLGSSIFLQAHLLLGLALGPVARELLGGLRLPALLALVALLVAAVVWLLRRRAGRTQQILEGCCPACLAAGALSSARLAAETRTAP